MGYVHETENGLMVELRRESIILFSRDGVEEFHADGMDAETVEVSYEFLNHLLEGLLTDETVRARLAEEGVLIARERSEKP